MSLKKKLFTTITMFALVFSMVLVGVWAISADTVSFGGTITFTATNILATISGEVSNTASNPTLQDLVYNSAGGPSADALNSWNNNLTFKEDGSAFSIEITIKNESSRKICWSITDTVASNANISKTISTYTLGETNELDGNGTTTFTITIGLANGTNNSVSGSYGYQIDLCDESEYVADVSTYDTLDFFTNPDGINTVSVMANQANLPTGEIVIPAKVSSGGTVYTVTQIAYNESSVAPLSSQEVKLQPKDSITVENGAFFGCSGLTSIIIPEGIKSIEFGAFHGCTGLTSITIPDSVTSIKNCAFGLCSSLTSITIPDSVTNIGIQAFYQSGLTSVKIGSGVTNIGREAFDYCNVKTVYIDSPTIAKNATTQPDISSWNLFDNTEYVYIKTTIIDISSSFTKVDNTEYDGYFKYTENITTTDEGGAV